MLDLDKIRSIQSLPHLSFEDSKLAIFTRLHKYEDALPLVLAEVDRLRSELAAAPEAARRWAAIREAVATVHAATGLAGDSPLTDDTVAELLANALQNASRAHFAETALWTDAEATARTIEHHRRLFVGQQARAERAELALAAAQPVVEWRPTHFGAAAQIGLWRLSVGAERWALRLKVPDSLGLAELIDSGEETGDAGKAAAEAAYRRACGFPTAPPCAG